MMQCHEKKESGRCRDRSYIMRMLSSLLMTAHGEPHLEDAVLAFF